MFSAKIGQRLAQIYKSDGIFFYFWGGVASFLGVKICDLIFYDQQKLLRVREQMQQQYWQKYGQPKYLQPEIVDSLLKPGQKRKTWIKIVLGKDKYVSKEQQYVEKNQSKVVASKIQGDKIQGNSGQKTSQKIV